MGRQPPHPNPLYMGGGPTEVAPPLKRRPSASGGGGLAQQALIANSLLVPHRGAWEDFRKLEAAAVATGLATPASLAGVAPVARCRGSVRNGWFATMTRAGWRGDALFSA